MPLSPTDPDATTVELLRESPRRRRKRQRDKAEERGSDCCSSSHVPKEEAEPITYVLRLVAEAPPPTSSPDDTMATRPGGPAAVAFGLEGTRFGRDPSCCDVVLSSGSISRLHTVLSVVGEDVCVHDKSHNGTFINGRLVGRGRCAILRDGDMVSFVNPTLPDVTQFSYFLEAPTALRRPGSGGAPGAGAFASLQRAGLTRYTLGPSIGQGSFATVRLGVDAQTGEKVAVKILEKDKFFSEMAFTSLHVEIEMMRGMDHPNIVRVRDAFEVPDMVALVMEYVRGGDLFDYVVGRGRNPFTEDEARFLFVQLLEAVIYIHSRRIVHCDLKPENVLVDVLTAPPSPAPARTGWETPQEGCPPPPPISAISVLDDHKDVAKSVSPFNVRLKLTDFGVAKYYGEGREDEEEDDDGEDGPMCTVSAAGGGVGTARYAAPEQLANARRANSTDGEGDRGAALTAAVDIWSLGVLLYVLCAGGLPRNVQHDARVRFSKHLSHLSEACRELIQGMMELDPAKRMRLYDICSHPWLAGVHISGKHLCSRDDDDAMSTTTTTLSPHCSRSLRPSATLPDPLATSVDSSSHIASPH